MLQAICEIQNVDANIKDSKQQTALLYAVQSSQGAQMIKTLAYLNNIDPNVSYEDFTVLKYAIQENNYKLCRTFVRRFKTKIDKSWQDKQGKSYVHLAINPIPLGSYENAKILKLLCKYQFPLNLIDKQNHFPIHYASQQASGVMKKILEEYGAQVIKVFQRTKTIYQREEEWPEPEFDYESDCQKYADQQSQVKPENLKDLVKPDKAGNFGVQFQVIFDEKIQKPFDILMTKVDIKQGPYGINLFYRMQFLLDSNREVYVIFTRWGRVGETGAFQRTPYKNLKDGEREFKKIFKQKSEND